MKRLIIAIVIIISLVGLQSCFRTHYLSQWTHYKFSDDYNPDEEGRLKINGFYSNSPDTCNPDTQIVLRPDGTVYRKGNYGIWNFGIYNVDKDTVKIFFFPKSDLIFKWDEGYVEGRIYEKRIIKLNKGLAPERYKWVGPCDNVYYFVPCSIEVPVNPIKYEKWIWADKKQWKQWVKDHPRPDDDNGF